MNATKTAAKWIRDNGYTRNAKVREAVELATEQATAYGKTYALSLYAGDDHLSRTVRDALKANGNLSGHGEIANCAETPAASTEDRIIAAIRELADLPGDLVSLARVRALIADVDHAEMTRVLKAMDRARVIQLDPDPNRKALPQIAIDSAVEIGGELKHLVSLV